jgi:type I restriction enzyme S subunit
MTIKPFPSSWLMANLGDICEIERGVTFPSDAQINEPSEKHVACLRTTNVQEHVDWNNLIYIPRSYAKNEKKHVQQGDILISIANSKELVGKVAFVDKVEVESVFGGFISIIRATEFIDPYYLYSFLRAKFIKKCFQPNDKYCQPDT